MAALHRGVTVSSRISYGLESLREGDLGRVGSRRPPKINRGACVIALDGGGLAAADIAAVAYREASVEVTPQARARVAASHEFAVRVSAERPVYGRTTGVGANRSERVVDPAEHARTVAQPRHQRGPVAEPR